MYRYYFHISSSTTEVYLNDGNNLKKVKFGENDFFYNTFKYDIDNGIELAYNDRDCLTNRFSLYEKNTDICGVKFTQSHKLFVMLRDIITKFIKQKQFELVIIINDDVKIDEEDVEESNKVWT